MSKKKHKKNNGSPAPAQPAKAEEIKAKEAVEATAREAGAKEAEPIEEAKPAENSPKKKKSREHGVEITKIKVIEDTKPSIMRVLDEALDENVEELEHPESTALQTAKKLSMRQLAITLFGFFMTVFAVIGIISTVGYVFDYLDKDIDDSPLKAEFMSIVAPLTASDSSVFDSTDMISEDMLITCAGWDIILNPQGYVEENDYYTVSQLDIDKRIASMFGAGLTYTHKTVGDEEISFVYDEETGMYIIPAFPQSPAYIPELRDYEETDSGYKVEVAYRMPITTIIEGNDSAEKIMIYTLTDNGTGLIISSLEISELITGEEL